MCSVRVLDGSAAFFCRHPGLQRGSPSGWRARDGRGPSAGPMRSMTRSSTAPPAVAYEQGGLPLKSGGARVCCCCSTARDPGTGVQGGVRDQQALLREIGRQDAAVCGSRPRTTGWRRLRGAPPSVTARNASRSLLVAGPAATRVVDRMKQAPGAGQIAAVYQKASRAARSAARARIRGPSRPAALGAPTRSRLPAPGPRLDGVLTPGRGPSAFPGHLRAGSENAEDRAVTVAFLRFGGVDFSPPSGTCGGRGCARRTVRSQTAATAAAAWCLPPAPTSTPTAGSCCGRPARRARRAPTTSACCPRRGALLDGGARAAPTSSAFTAGPCSPATSVRPTSHLHRHGRRRRPRGAPDGRRARGSLRDRGGRSSARHGVRPWRSWLLPASGQGTAGGGVSSGPRRAEAAASHCCSTGSFARWAPTGRERRSTPRWPSVWEARARCRDRREPGIGKSRCSRNSGTAPGDGARARDLRGLHHLRRSRTWSRRFAPVLGAAPDARRYVPARLRARSPRSVPALQPWLPLLRSRRVDRPLLPRSSTRLPGSGRRAAARGVVTFLRAVVKAPSPSRSRTRTMWTSRRPGLLAALGLGRPIAVAGGLTRRDVGRLRGMLGGRRPHVERRPSPADATLSPAEAVTEAPRCRPRVGLAAQRSGGNPQSSEIFCAGPPAVPHPPRQHRGRGAARLDRLPPADRRSSGARPCSARVRPGADPVRARRGRAAAERRDLGPPASVPRARRQRSALPEPGGVGGGMRACRSGPAAVCISARASARATAWRGRRPGAAFRARRRSRAGIPLCTPRGGCGDARPGSRRGRDGIPARPGRGADAGRAGGRRSALWEALGDAHAQSASSSRDITRSRPPAGSPLTSRSAARC